MQRLKISDNKRFLMYENGKPFFWLGDTAWELFHKLSREDAEHYLRDRAEKKFNVIQAVALAEFDGLNSCNAYCRVPLLKNVNGEYDPIIPDISGDYSYWDHVDYIIEKAAELGLYIAFLPTWGDKINKLWGKGPEIFNKENAYFYGKWIGARYKNQSNIIWVVGGDRTFETRRHFDVINEMARGIKEADGTHLMTFHPNGYKSSSLHVHEEKWLDFNMIQSGHGRTNVDNYSFIKEDYGKLPVKPTLDGEPRYEDHPIKFKPENGYFDDFDVRQGAYWSVFSGAFGHTYGHHSVWSMCTEPTEYFIMKWKDALSRPGATQMKYLRELVESRPFMERVPDQDVIAENYSEANYQAATRGSGYAFIYSPYGLKIKVNMGRISGDKVKGTWFNPRSGEHTTIGQFMNSGVKEFIPLTSGRNNDWVLILDDGLL